MKKVFFTLCFTLSILGFVNAQTLVDFSDDADYDVSGSWGYTTAPEVSGDTLIVDKDLDATFDAGVQVAITTPVTVLDDHTLLAVKTRLSGATATGMRLYAKVFYSTGVVAEGWTNNVTEIDGRFSYIVWDGITPGEVVDTVILHLGGWDNGNSPADLQGEVAIDEIAVWNKKMIPAADFENAGDYGLHHWGYTTDPVVEGGVLKVVKDSDATFDQQINIGLNNLIPVAGGSTRLAINMKSSVTGARLYARATYTDGTAVESWTTNVIETADEANALIMDGLTIGKTIDTIKINIGGWDNGNSPADLQATYEVTDIYLTEPPIEYVDPRTVIEIKHTTGDIDFENGPAEEDWINATPYMVANRDTADSPEDLTFKGTFRALWDEDYLYLFVEMDDKDPYEFDDVAGTMWQKDGVQLYIDVRNQLLDGRRENARQHQLSINYATTPISDDGLGIGGWDGAVVDSIYDDRDKAVYAEYGFLPKAGGYYMELGIPWGSMYYDATNEDADSYAKAYGLKDIKAGSVIAFDIQCNDGDADSRANLTTWSSHSGDDPGSYQNSGVWGGLKLVAADGTPIVKTQQANARIYPNPASSNLYIEMEGLQSVNVYDLTGRQVISKDIDADGLTLSLEGLNSGIYLIQVNGTEGVASKTIQVQ